LTLVLITWIDCNLEFWMLWQELNPSIGFIR
jgi:hypothetical protein